MRPTEISTIEAMSTQHRVMRRMFKEETKGSMEPSTGRKRPAELQRTEGEEEEEEEGEGSAMQRDLRKPDGIEMLFLERIGETNCIGRVRVLVGGIANDDLNKKESLSRVLIGMDTSEKSDWGADLSSEVRRRDEPSGVQCKPMTCVERM